VTCWTYSAKESSKKSINKGEGLTNTLLPCGERNVLTVRHGEKGRLRDVICPRPPTCLPNIENSLFENNKNLYALCVKIMLLSASIVNKFGVRGRRNMSCSNLPKHCPQPHFAVQRL